MMTTLEQSPEVLVATGGVVCLTAAEARAIGDRASRSQRRRARLCAHPQPSDPLHEMIIALARGTYIRPHRHAGKSESFHIIEGELAVVLFEEAGAIRDVIRMGPYQSGRVFFYRLMEPLFHTVLVNSARVLFHETTNGPFDPADTEFAPWSPAEDDPAAPDYLHALRGRLLV
jgi:cupin fold WbuC family metalloprotein